MIVAIENQDDVHYYFYQYHFSIYFVVVIHNYFPTFYSFDEIKNFLLFKRFFSRILGFGNISSFTEIESFMV